MTDDLDLLAAHESAARARMSAAVRSLRTALAPAALTRRAVQARPWPALAVAGAGGVAIGAWLSGRNTGPRPAAGPTRPPGRRLIDVLTQVGQVVASVAAAKAAHDRAAAEPAHV